MIPCLDLLDQCRSLLYSLLLYTVKFNMKVVDKISCETSHVLCAGFNINDCFRALESSHTVGKLVVQKRVV